MLERLFACFFLGILLNVFSPAWAVVSLAPIFGDGAVLQRNAKVSIWGTAAIHEKVCVKIDKQSKSTVANDKGLWSVVLDPLSVGDKRLLTVSSSANALVRHVVVGDVILCSGQSNMNLSMIDSDCTEEERQEPAKSGVSIFRVRDKDSGPYAGMWTVPVESNLDSMPAIPFMLARKLAKKTLVPTGVICAAASGAGIESFLPPETIARTPCLAPNPASRFPVGRNFKTLLEPNLGYSVCAFVWYQGESNIRQAAAYRTMFPAFITDLRKRMSAPKLPFYFVQLPGFGPYVSNPQSSQWAEFRESQSVATLLPNVFMTVSLDTAEDATLHPREKRILASRLADNIGLKWSAPQKNIYSVRDDAILVEFGERAQNVHTDNQEDPRGFQIAGVNHVFYQASAELSDHSALVKSARVLHPVSVRYAWADSPDCNVKLGDLPLPPFRADAWAH
ncbi:MAG: sialate O-acetylesterase [Candidatus Obscuribacterales bacterium]|nr:sialate O-acetylesterase [Candidatus Obscuribacterales bacterium]